MTTAHRMCPVCKRELTAASFNRDASKPSGRQSLCRRCHKARRSMYQAKDAERHAAWRVFNGFKKFAHRAVAKALESGALVKPDACMQCGSGKRLDAHHVDYEKPMEVLFLCRPCHAAIHNAEKRAADGRVA